MMYRCGLRKIHPICLYQVVSFFFSNDPDLYFVRECITSRQRPFMSLKQLDTFSRVLRTFKFRTLSFSDTASKMSPWPSMPQSLHLRAGLYRRVFTYSISTLIVHKPPIFIFQLPGGMESIFQLLIFPWLGEMS